MYCEKCGKEVAEDTIICPQCNAILSNRDISGEREWFLTLLMAWFGGAFGIHRLYTGYIGIAIAQILTLGGCGIWTLVDFIMICLGEYKTKEGKQLNGYVKCLAIPAIFIYLLLGLTNIIIRIASHAHS